MGSGKSIWRVLKKQTMYKAYKGSEIVNNPQLVMNLSLQPGDVIQEANKNLFGALGDATHSMYITGTGSYNGNQTYLLTYHSNNTYSKSLLEICNSNPSQYFIFYKMI